MAPRHERLSQQVLGLGCCCKLTSGRKNDKGIVWVQKTILQIKEFSHKMWEHRNAVLHDTQLESSLEWCEMQKKMMQSQNYMRRCMLMWPKTAGILMSL
jgi:hypothetical protein